MDNLEIDPFDWKEDNSTFSFHELLLFFWKLRYWILLSVFISFICAFFYIKMAIPSFSSTEKVMLMTDDGTQSSEMSFLADLTGKKISKKIDNEIEVINSPLLMKQVVEELHLNYKYCAFRLPIFNSRFPFLRSIFNVKRVEFYQDSPIALNLIVDSLKIQSIHSLRINFSTTSPSTFVLTSISLNGEDIPVTDKEYKLGQPITINSFLFNISGTGKQALMPKSEYGCVFQNSYDRAIELMQSLSVSGSDSKDAQTDLITLSQADSDPERAKDILSTLVDKYNQQARAYKNEAGLNTIQFIDKRLEIIRQDLNNVESSKRVYQSNNSVVDMQSQSELAINTDAEKQERLTEAKMQLQILGMLKSYIDGVKSKEYKVIPVNVGISDQTLNIIIGQYNDKVSIYNRLLANSSKNNPRVLNAEQDLIDGKHSINLAIQGLYKSNLLKERELTQNLASSKRAIANIPTQQFDLAQINRKQQIIEPLYLLLQQKREEAQIAVCATTDNVRVIFPAYANSSPSRPKSHFIFGLALIIGLFLPIAIVLARIFFKSKVETRRDIEKALTAPILAILPIDKQERRQIPFGGHDFMAEAFRNICSNLLFIKGKVIQVTSSTHGEGKSFISSNLAIALSSAKKKVLLIGLDLRKPTLRHCFQGDTFDRHFGVVNYLIEHVENLDELIVHSNVNENLDIIISGKIPPNPMELLSLPRFGEMIKQLRSRYDYIICDTAPLFLVSDSTIINKYVDYTLYVIRANYTELQALPEIERICREKELKDVNIIFNALDPSSAKYKYGYYGYGYGDKYGYGYGYGEARPKKNKWTGMKMRMKSLVNKR